MDDIIKRRLAEFDRVKKGIVPLMCKGFVEKERKRLIKKFIWELKYLQQLDGADLEEGFITYIDYWENKLKRLK